MTIENEYISSRTNLQEKGQEVAEEALQGPLVLWKRNCTFHDRIPSIYSRSANLKLEGAEVQEVQEVQAVQEEAEVLQEHVQLHQTRNQVSIF
jgi:hypothetical protein